MTMKKLIQVEAKQLVNSLTSVFFDCDGVLWNSVEVLPKAKEFVNKLKDANKQVFFVTNNNMKTREGMLQNFLNNGFHAEADEVLSSAYLTALYVKNIIKLPDHKKVYLIGSKGLADEFDLLGIKHIGYGPRGDSSRSSIENPTQKDEDVGAVVVSYDEYFNMHKVSEALQYLINPSMPFIATNLDVRYPIRKGFFAPVLVLQNIIFLTLLLSEPFVFNPGTGSIVAAVTAVAERQPIVTGKPNKMFLDIAQTTHKIDPQTSLMIGDRLDTDMKFGHNCGLKTLCVLTGITDEHRLRQAEQGSDNSLIPDYYADDLTVLHDAL